MQLNNPEDQITDNLDLYYNIMNKEDYNKNLNYEDPILLNEIKRQMKELKDDLLSEGIAVAHADFDESHPKSYGKGDSTLYYDLDKYGYKTSDEYGMPEMKGRYFMTRNPNTIDNQKYFQNYPEGILNMPGVNVPLTPSLDNYFTMAEEAAHAYNYLNPEENQRIIGNMKTLGPLAELTARTDEEFIAKDMAKEMIGGYTTPDTQALIDYTKKGYIDSLMQKIFAEQYEYDFAKNPPDTIYNYLQPDGSPYYDRIDDAYDAVGTTPMQFALDVFSDRYPGFFNDEEFLNFKPVLKDEKDKNKSIFDKGPYIARKLGNFLGKEYYPYYDPFSDSVKGYTLTDEDIANFQTYEEFLKSRSDK